jgi:serine/threonine protein kinase
MSDTPSDKSNPGDTNQTVFGRTESIHLGGSSSAGKESAPAALPEFPGYEVLSKIGEGGMGAVYRARQRTLDRMVAIKALPARLSENKQYTARLDREAKVLARINHQNVVSCFDLSEHNGMRYVVMEYVEGQDLATLIDKRKFLPAGEALSYLKQAVLGLDHANALGIIHRDIKPENMLLAKPPAAGTTIRFSVGHVLKIADLGLAAFTGEATENTRLTTEGSTLGSPHYMSPEQTIGETNVDFRTDIYALGITLYHMVTGETPYAGPTVGAVLARKLTERIKDPREFHHDLSPQLSLLIHKMTARKKEDRHASYGELMEDIEALEHCKPISAVVLPEERASVTLLPETIELLSVDEQLHASGHSHTAGAPPPARASNNGTKFALAFVAAGIAVVVALIASNPSSKENPDSKGTLTTPTPAPAVLPEKVPDAPRPPALPIESFEEKSLIGTTASDWKFAAGTKIIVQDSELQLIALADWAMAQRELPATQFVLRAEMHIPRGADCCEVHVALTKNAYLAVGLRWMEGMPLSAYAETRDSTSNAATKTWQSVSPLKAEEWQKFKVNVWDGKAEISLNNVPMIVADIDPVASKVLRVAVRNGEGQFRNLEVAPRPAPK